MKFANIIFDRNERLTIGDDIQLIAIEMLYKYMKINYEEVVRIPFHSLGDYDGEYVVLPISFPLFGFHAEMKITQFSPKIIPVFLGLSTLSDEYTEDEKQYLKRFEPIGCRDAYTMQSMRKNGIMSYLNCCMTATLPSRPLDIEGDTIYCIDVQKSLLPYIPEEMKKVAKFTSHTFYPSEFSKIFGGREGKAKELLVEYAKHAKLIITSRLHAALPCVAMGIPTILAKDALSFRFLGMNRLIHVYTKEEYSNIDWNPAKIEYESIKELMLKNAAERILGEKEKYEKIYEISAFFEEHKSEDYYVEFFTNTIDFITNILPKNQEFSYVLWGVTQTATMVYKYLKEHYPKAKLVQVIDKKKRLEFEGVTTTTKEVLKKEKEAWCFVCTGAAIKESYEYFSEIGHKKFYQCCEDGNKHRFEEIFKNSYNNVCF